MATRAWGIMSLLLSLLAALPASAGGPSFGSTLTGGESQLRPRTDPAPPPPAGSAAAAHGYAASVGSMTGTQYDSQSQVQGATKKMNTTASSSSREVGSMDILEALLILPFNPSRAAKLLTSGQQAHSAAVEMDQLTSKTNGNQNLMQGTTAAAGTTANSGASADAGTAGNSSGASSSHAAANPAAAERAGELYGKLDAKYGMGRADFENEVRRVNGDPEAVGAFMEELTGDKAIGRDAVNAALNKYAQELGLTRAELARSARPGAEENAHASPSAPAATLASAAPKAAPAPEPARAPAAAKEKDKKELLREKLRKALADRQGGTPGGNIFGADTLTPIRDQFFEKLHEEEEQNLFQVVHAKYAEKRTMLERGSVASP